MLLFAAATQGYFIARSRIWESAALLLVAFTLFVPNFWLNQVQDRFAQTDPAALEATLDAAEPGDRIRFAIEGPDFVSGAPTRFTIAHDIEGEASGAERLADIGFFLLPEEGRVVMEEPAFGSRYERDLQRFDFYAPDNPVVLARVEVPADRMPAQVFYLPALLLLALVVMMQRRRQTKPAF
jgi:hypothetical protein